MRFFRTGLLLVATPSMLACSSESSNTGPISMGATAGAPVTMMTTGGTLNTIPDMATPSTGGQLAMSSGGAAPVVGMGGASNVSAGGTLSAGGMPVSMGGMVAAAGMSSSAEDPGTDGDGIFSLQGPYQASPDSQQQQGVPQGELLRFTVSSSTIYPDANNRNVAIYVPQQYVAGTPAPVMVFQDGTDFFGFDGIVPTVLDNLIADGRIPPIVGVFAGNGGGDGPGSERGLEYDTVSGLYAQWVDEELLPAVEAETEAQLPDQAVTFTKDPEGRAAMGGSSGGAGSFSMVWWRPDLFRRVITFSGTYVNQVPADSPFPHGAWVYHDIDPYDDMTPNGLIVAFCENESGIKTSSEVEACDTPLSESECLAVAGCRWNTTQNKPIRVWLAASSNDLGANRGPESYRDFRLANQRMAQALMMRGYHVHYDDCEGAGHVDQNVVKATLPDAMEWVWRGYTGGM